MFRSDETEKQNSRNYAAAHKLRAHIHRVEEQPREPQELHFRPWASPPCALGTLGSRNEGIQLLPPMNQQKSCEAEHHFKLALVQQTKIKQPSPPFFFSFFLHFKQTLF